MPTGITLRSEATKGVPLYAEQRVKPLTAFCFFAINILIGIIGNYGYKKGVSY